MVGSDIENASIGKHDVDIDFESNQDGLATDEAENLTAHTAHALRKARARERIENEK